MAYVLLIHERTDWRHTRPTEEGRVAWQRMEEFAGMLQQRGVLRACESLKPAQQGLRIEVRDGQRRQFDGPFAEAREIVGGFFLLDCASHADALALAHLCPAAEWATVELREVGPCFEG